MDNKIKILESYGAEAIKPYTLISNYGYQFFLYGNKYDIRYWANCYGCAINRWEIHAIERKDHGESEAAAAIDTALYKLLKEIEKEFNEAGA